MTSGCLKRWRDEMRCLSLPVLILVAVFAIASWIDLNGIYVELPLMVNRLPEGWNLPSYIVIITQAANVAPLVYTILRKLFPDKVREWFVVVLIICIGVTSCVLLGFFWDYTTGSDELTGEGGTSTALFSLATFLAVVDCTSSVVFLPYMATFREQYLNALYFGEGLSGLIPAILGLIQGVGGDPQCINTTSINNNSIDYQIIAVYSEPVFSVNTFYFILSGILFISLISFLIVHFHPAGKREREFRKWNAMPVRNGNAGDANKIDPGFDDGSNSSDSSLSEDNTSTSVCSDIKPSNETQNGHANLYSEAHTSVQLTSFQKVEVEFQINTNMHDTQIEAKNNSTHTNEIEFKKSESLLKPNLMTTLIIVGWINCLSNGVLPSIQSYSCLPYGNTAYNLSVRLSVVANPIACFLGIFLTVKSVWAFGALTLVATGCAAYQIALAALSPYPPLYDQESGAALAIITFVVLTALFSYTKMCCAARLAEKSGAEGLLWCGVVTQLGSCIGAIIIFILINVVKVFTSKDACT